MRQNIQKSVEDAMRACQYLAKQETLDFIEQAATAIAQVFKKGGKLLIAGNGGSLCDAMHFAEELTGQFRKPRPALPAIALSDPGHLTCVSNDMGFDRVFSRGVEALGKKEDVLVVLSTSGNSLNILHALDLAQKKEMKTIAFLGKEGGKVKGLASLEWIVSGFKNTDRIQEVHMAAIHIIIEVIEKQLFYSSKQQKNLHCVSQAL